jgi:hypothetical protein
MCDDACKVFTESSLQIFPSPDGSWAQLIKPLEWDSFQHHGKEECFDVITTTG